MNPQPLKGALNHIERREGGHLSEIVAPITIFSTRGLVPLLSSGKLPNWLVVNTMPASAQKIAREDAQERKDQILDEAIRILGQRGYYGFTVQDLAKRCGLSNAGLLYYFGSKDLLLVAALDELERRETALIEPQLRRALGPDQGPSAVIDLIRALSQIGVSDPEVLRLDVVLRAESLDRTHPAHATFLSREKRLIDLLSKAVASYVPAPRVTARRISAMLDGMAEHWLRSNKSFDLVEECTGSVGAILADAKRSAPKPRRSK